MSGTNLAIQVGRLVRDPELRTVNQTVLAAFTVANNYVYKSNGEKREEVLFLDCVAWGKLAEIISQYCKKGKQIAVSGRLRLNQWQASDGTNRSKIELIVDKMEMLGSQGGNANRPPSDSYGSVTSGYKQPEQDMAGEENQSLDAQRGQRVRNQAQDAQQQTFDESDIPF